MTRETNEIEVTQEMIDAGVEANLNYYADLAPSTHGRDVNIVRREMVRDVIKAAWEAGLNIL